MRNRVQLEPYPEASMYLYLKLVNHDYNVKFKKYPSVDLAKLMQKRI